MTDHPQKPTEELLAGRRALDGVCEADVVNDWWWYEQARAWVIRVRLEADVAEHSSIPPITNWFVHCATAYPWGRVRFYPAKEGGITSTYHHQWYNAAGSDDVPWREGWLCLTAPAADALRITDQPQDEPTDAHRRLEWHFRRALQWLYLASRGMLVNDGDPFELPHFPSSGPTVAFIETPDTFDEWSSESNRVGLSKISVLDNNGNVSLVRAFKTLCDSPLLAPRWQEGRMKEASVGAWIRLDEVPVMRDWKVPATWPDLLNTGGQVSDLLRQAANCLRDGNRHLLLIGFPIPQVFGGPPVRIHWQAAMLPALTSRPQDGFRAKEVGYWRRDKNVVFHKDETKQIDWRYSQNWAADQLSTRGRFSEELCSKKVLLLGCGALGAPVAETLVRGGVGRLVLMDGDSLAAGNLMRHTLTVCEVGSNKATALAARLNHTGIHAEVQAIAQAFPPQHDEGRQLIADCDLVVDCTADDDVLRFLETYQWDRNLDFTTLSVGFAACSLYCFSARGDSFPRPVFLEQFTPHWERERCEHPLDELPWEGIGCWHPVFPARIDDIWLMASVAAKFIAGTVDGRYPKETLLVFTQQQSEGVFQGIHAESSVTTDGIA